MQVLYNKKALCYIEIGDFSQIQGIGTNPIYERYDTIATVLKKVIAPEYHSFLAQPILSQNKDIIDWYSQEWKEKPIKFTNLREGSQDREKYLLIKEQTLNHYRKCMNDLDADSPEKKILSKVLKFYDDAYIYCYDGIVVLSVWGMKIRETIIKPIGEIVHAYDEETSCKIRFDIGEGATFCYKNDSEISRKAGSVLAKEDIPPIIPKDGFYFLGWHPEPLDYEVNEDVTFTAKYDTVRKNKITFDAGNHGSLNGFSELSVVDGSAIQTADIPSILPHEGYTFNSWSPSDPRGIVPQGDITFIAQYQKTEEEKEENITPEKKPEFVELRFDAGTEGETTGQAPTLSSKPKGYVITPADIPGVKPKRGYTFSGWDENPVNKALYYNTTFRATYKKKLPWHKRFRLYLTSLWGKKTTGSGESIWKKILKWALRLLLLLLLLLLLFFLTKSCNSCSVGDLLPDLPGSEMPLPDGDSGNESRDGISDVPDGNNGGEGGVNDQTNGNGANGVRGIDQDAIIPGRPVVPPIKAPDGNLPPIIENPGVPRVIADRLNLYFEDTDTDLKQFVQDFKQVYPDEKYQVIGYDDKAMWIQIQIPPAERNQVRQDINSKLDKYKFFVVDESLFEGKQSSKVSKAKAPGWHLKAVGAQEAWKTTKGSSDIVVAVVDDGIDSSHRLLKDKIVKPYNVFTQSDKLTTGTGHGTHVAGLAVANSDLSIGVSGIAPDCKLMPVQVSESEICTFSSLVNGILYAVHSGADVVNISIASSFKGLGILPEDEQMNIIKNRFKSEEWVWHRVLNIAQSKNTVLVFAAGNDKVLTNLPPEHRTNRSINVTAVDKNISGSGFTNYGNGSVVAAPGVDIYSTYPVNTFNTLDGTSMAAPIVTGTVALMKSLNKSLTTSQIIHILTQTGKPAKGNVGPMIQVDKALNMIQTGLIPDANTETIEDINYNPINPTPYNNESDYDAIRKQIEEYRRKIKDLEKLLPENN